MTKMSCTLLVPMGQCAKMRVHPQCPFTEAQVQRFLSHQTQGRNGCIIWTGALCGEYGRVTIAGKAYSAHRASFLISNGTIPDGLVIRHKCDNPPCINPDHLELGTHKDNCHDAWKRGRGCPPRGERAGNHVLTAKQVKEIKQKIISGISTQLQIAAQYGVKKSTINAIRSGTSWSTIGPIIPIDIPKPHRKMSDQDYLDIRQKWRDGATLKQLAAAYECRVDGIQAIIVGKRGVKVAIGEVPDRANKTKFSFETRNLIRQMHVSGHTQRDLAKMFHMSKNGLNNLIHANDELTAC